MLEFLLMFSFVCICLLVLSIKVFIEDVKQLKIELNDAKSKETFWYHEAKRLERELIK
jgi:hypothetical protein